MSVATRERRRLARVVDGCAAVMFYGGLALFGVMCLAWSLPAGLLDLVLSKRLGAPIGRWGIMAGFRIFLAVMKLLGLFRCDLTALDELRRAGPMIIAVNHPSLLDAVLVISRLPRVVCITKAALWDNWFLGGGIRLAGYIRNDAPLALTKLAVKELRAGRQLLIFPEGTRSAGGAVGPFRGGFAIMAAGAGVPVQTVLLESDTAFLTKGWPLFRRPRLPLAYRARLGARFEVVGGSRVFTAELQSYFLNELSKGGLRGAPPATAAEAAGAPRRPAPPAAS